MILSKIYQWRRFWSLREGVVDLSDGGYLRDPEGENADSEKSHSKPFEAIEGVPCLALLGEPGIGKSQWCESEEKAITARLQGKGDDALWVDAGSYSEANDLVANIFRSRQFEDWVKGQHRLHLFLDALDECCLWIRNAPKRLAQELKKYPKDRLNLRVFCRTADWPHGFEERLTNIWGQDHFKVYELNPLRRIDVQEKAMAEASEPDRFLAELESKGLVPFAIKPQTLDFLVKTYNKSDGQFPLNKIDLYKQGCMALCEEPNQDRRDEKLTGKLGPDKLLAIASRIAALSVFGNRAAIWKGLDTSPDAPENDLLIRDIANGLDKVAGHKFLVTREAIDETLQTALFTGRGPNRMGWAHLAYAEFLSALYLVDHDLPLPQVMSFILPSPGGNKRVAFQLYETACWLAMMRLDVFENLLDSDPEALLCQDFGNSALIDANVRKQELVIRLLQALEEGRIVDARIARRRDLGNLFYPELADRLRPYIVDRNRDFIARRVAVDIAEQCSLKELQSIIADVALDVQEDDRVRIPAAQAVLEMGDEDIKARLKPLAIGEGGDDPDDELKGYALLAVWPRHMSAEELFANLTPPKNPQFFGAYRFTFLRYELIDRLRPQHLVPSLMWVQRQTRQSTESYVLQHLVDSIMADAYEHLEFSGVLEEFAKAADSRLQNHEQILDAGSKKQTDEIWFSDDAKRHSVVMAIVKVLSESPQDQRWKTPHISVLLTGADVQWLVDNYREAQKETAKHILAQILYNVFDPTDADQLDAVSSLTSCDPYLANLMIPKAGPVAIDSDVAEWMKAQYRREKRQDLAKQQVKEAALSVDAVAKLLDRTEAGDMSAFADMVTAIISRPPGSGPYEAREASLAEWDGWKSADNGTNKRIFRAALNYLVHGDPETDRWVGSNQIFVFAVAGYEALRLLSKITTDFPVEVWQKWTTVILAMSWKDEDPAHHELVKVAYSSAPEDFLRSVMLVIDNENQKSKFLHVIRVLEHCWDDRIATALADKLNDCNLTATSVGSILEQLLDHKVQQARIWAESLLTPPFPEGEADREKKLVAASSLMTHASDGGWSIVWPLIQTDQDFGRDLITAVADHADLGRSDVISRYFEEQLAELYVWMARQYPPTKDPASDRFLQGGPQASVTDWRDAVLSNLEGRGTSDSVKAMEYIIEQFPEYAHDLRWALHDAEVRAHWRDWKPRSPKEILAIVSDRLKRWVDTEDELLEVVMESLRRFEARIRSKSSVLESLWNVERKKNKYWPKDEAALSNALKEHLEEELIQKRIVVNREVQIRQKEFTDIHADALGSGEGRDKHYRLIIEVKGCWNRNLETDIENQLLNKYLKDNQDCRQGIYVIGWYYCANWNAADKKKRVKNRLGEIPVDEAQERFEGRARQLSQDCGKEIRAVVLDTSIP
jgi:hypothetical protein